ncbi:MAG: GrpB family protein [bacterium]|nr:GrpB family protein [bacterium]
METLQQRIERVVREKIAISPYDPRWPESFRREKAHLRACLPGDLVRRIEHFGSTAVPGLAAKPVVDMLVEVTDLEATRRAIAPLLESQHYDYFWRPTHGDDGPPFYAWFIKRDAATGARTHHIHMVESGPEFAGHWDRLLFRDFLIEHPGVARDYETLKRRLASTSPRDRVAYTRGKTEFIVGVTAQAKNRYGGSGGDCHARRGRSPDSAE